MSDSAKPVDMEDNESKSQLTSLFKTAASDLRVIIVYPLCTGIMTGFGFILGKRIGESYFYGGIGKSPQ